MPPALNDFVTFFAKEGLHVVGLAVASLVYLLVDFFIVIKAFKPIFRPPSFWFFWFCTFVLNILAFEALSQMQDQAKLGSFGPAQTLALVIMSTFGTIAILQSFTLKIGDRKVVDFSRIMEDFRTTVLEDVSRQAAAEERKFARRTADRLFKAYRDSPDELRKEFVNVMSFGGRDAAQIQADLARIDEDVRTLKVEAVRVLAQRIAQADVREASRLAWKAETIPTQA